MKYSKFLWVFAVTAILLSAPLPSYSQDLSQLTPEQRQKLQQLTPEQRQKLLEEMNKSETKKDAPLTQPDITAPRPSTETSTTSLPEVKADGGLKPATPTETQETQRVQKKLQLFGYNLFRDVATTFAPATDIPVPSTYIIGPGDTIRVQLYGKEGGDYSLVVGRDGQLNFPDLGPISVSGLRYGEMESLLLKRISEQMIGVKASIAMGPLRSIQVFILGDAVRPGSYTISALSTMTNALFVSGGVKEIGSLRDIQLKRSGRVVRHLDLYDLLLQGDTSADVRLQPGDVLFIPPIGRTVGVAGEVRRPAIYELRTERAVKDVLAMAGGLLPTAFPKVSQIERIDAAGNRTLLDLNLTLPELGEQLLRDGDVLRIYSALDQIEDFVLLKGHVDRPGAYQWREGIRISDLLLRAGQRLKLETDLTYALIRREKERGKRIEVLAFEPQAVLAEPYGAADLPLEARDQVYIFSLYGDRQSVLQSLITELKQQAVPEDYAREVTVSGAVRHPGTFPLLDGMRLSDVLKASGAFQQSAYTLEAEITRYAVANGKQFEAEHISVKLAEILSGIPLSDLELRPLDRLFVKQVPDWAEQESVEVKGEVLFPGSYTIKKGETLRQLVQRAGGLTERAYAQGSVFLREHLRVQEQIQIDALRERLRADLAASALQQAQQTPEQQQAVVLARGLLAQLETSKAVGRMAIRLPDILEGASDDVTLRNGDRLLVPRIPQEVTVLGEVNYPTSHIFDRSLSLREYLDRSGGLTYKADGGRIYVVRANGEVIATSDSWFRAAALEPGDTIVVPLDADRIKPLFLWTSVTQIIYQLALAAAAFHTFGAF